MVVLPPITLRGAVTVCGTSEDHFLAKVAVNVNNKAKSTKYGKAKEIVSNHDKQSYR
jgi:hypothetical protein